MRKERDKVHKASKRASETCEQTLHRLEQNQTHMASMRASQTFEQTILGVPRKNQRRNKLDSSMLKSKNQVTFLYTTVTIVS